MGYCISNPACCCNFTDRIHNDIIVNIIHNFLTIISFVVISSNEWVLPAPLIYKHTAFGIT